MRQAKAGEFRSTVYTNRPPYADFEAPQKFEAIKGIIARRLREHPNAMCSYSGGSDSDILLHLIEQVREVFALPPVHYYFFETGLEMSATRRHVKEQAERYGVEITTVRPKKNIVQATREYGQPFYVSDADKAWYKEYYGLRYSDAYEVYGLKRTGCCGCAISARAAADLERIRPYEPNVVRAAWAIFGDSYRYREKYNEYKRQRMEQERRGDWAGQERIF